MMKSLEGERVVCVGGSSGMGLGIARQALKAGAQVVVTSRSDAKAAKSAERLDGRATGLGVDLADRDSMRRFANEVGRVDHLMITAGAVGRDDFETDPDEARRFMDIKLWGTQTLIYELRGKFENHASIGLLSGGYARWATKDAAQVHVAFNAIEALGRAIAISMAPIRCNVIRPGFVDTGLWDFMGDDERASLRAQEAKNAPIGRVVGPDDIGDAAVMLMRCTAINGCVIPVDGGRHLRPVV